MKKKTDKEEAPTPLLKEMYESMNLRELLWYAEGWASHCFCSTSVLHKRLFGGECPDMPVRLPLHKDKKKDKEYSVEEELCALNDALSRMDSLLRDIVVEFECVDPSNFPRNISTNWKKGRGVSAPSGSRKDKEEKK